MRILIVKMSSMGDVLHTLPALTDAANHIHDIQFDWVVEPAFADIPPWHPAVKNVIELPLREIRKHPINTLRNNTIAQFKKIINKNKYDLVIDAQGLLKSALVSKMIKAPAHGLDKNSAREPLSSMFYQKKYVVDKNLHAITRTRELFSKSLGYETPNSAPDFSIDTNKLSEVKIDLPKNYLVFCHGTTWETKHYPDIYWEKLIKFACNENINVLLPWGNEKEKARAEKLAINFQNAKVLPKLSISEIAAVLSNANAVISVDTGLGHLSAALNTPTISLYGATNPKNVGAIGKNSIHLTSDFACAPCVRKKCSYTKANDFNISPACYSKISPERVWEQLIF